ncbi:hypothetical protein BGX24_000819 [Mortierella sp. AD032]|nr:hypothetical protein BGX24_000819 [Mortierella sp. AD032]
MIFAKFIAPIALLLTVSAGSWESVCEDGDNAVFISNNKHQTGECLTVPISDCKDKWGGGRSECNGGTYQVYWNLSGSGDAWLCYGKMSSCKHIKATKDWSLAENTGYDTCWSAQV